ncbi:pectate lyase superfamily protein-domain-containing protein [Mycena rosella]|uniref:Pectate lyase superfamily protein-domain-containing protein n=1 Tax=Mycena rosella TaxID=1033263 RepID=A0AAD7CME1_MYCRO|nr:pectate lyase superfamily protein-domain-containing protein [Mycena rosella]
MHNGGLHVLGKSAYNPGYKVFRDVQVDYGAKGDGVTDDTDAINLAISDGARCGLGCVSSSITPAIVYFPPGKYRVIKPIVPYYFTSLVGDYNNKPVLFADPGFVGEAVIDADPYKPGVSNADGSGINWWKNQNNFFRSVRNFVIDVTAVSPDQYGTGIHWQVGQATSLINIDFKMSSAPGTKHQGVYAENGSGGFMSDLTFDGGAFGLWISNQQFTVRNIKITNAGTAIYQQWNWGFTWQNIQISNCQVGFDLNTGGLTLDTQSAAGVLIVDSSISNTGIGIRMSSTQPTSLAGSLVLDEVVFSGISTANIQDSAGVVLAANSGAVGSWFQGNVYLARGVHTLGQRPEALTDSTGAFFAKSRPQYQDYSDEQFLSIMALKELGAAGDGVTDDTVAVNTFLQKYSGCAILLFEAGTYLVTDTIFVPAGTIIVGEMFSVIMGSGPKFADQNSPTPVIRVGNPGDTGAVEISDMVITTTGGSAGAIGIEWNIKESSQGAAGMWDVHVRLGGAKGTNINAANCPTSSTDMSKCASAFLGIHITKTGSGYFENIWVWNADHDLDDPAETQLNVFSARGVLVESTGPVWLVGTASEHHVIYQYAFNNARNIYAGLMQTETPYFQPTPNPPAPFFTNSLYGDPPGTQLNAWGLVITGSYDVFVYGAGFYSFFQTYSQNCVPNRNCQDSMVLVDQQSTAIYLYQLTTAGSTNMLSYPNVSIAKQTDNINGFASTLSLWEAPSITAPADSCGGSARRAVAQPRRVNPRSNLLPRQSEDFNYYSLNHAKIATDLMVGGLDGDGSRKPRQNCVFYVNQRDVDPEDPNYAKNRAIEFAALMNAQNPGSDYHTLYDVYDTAAAFSYTENPMASAWTGGNLRTWFQDTSQAFAELCSGHLYLIVDAEPEEIWDQSIWITHEWPAVVATGLVTQVTEIRPEDVGRAVADNGRTRFIRFYPYRGGQPPGATPPRDGDQGEIDSCVSVDPDVVDQWAGVVDVSGDFAPFKEGTCTMHIHQYFNENAGGGTFGDPQYSATYSVEVTMYDDGATHKIGFQSRLDAPYNMVSKFDNLFVVTPVEDGDYIQFTLGDQTWRNDDGSCSVGGWDHGADRQMDCGFTCTWGGGDSTDPLSSGSQKL